MKRIVLILTMAITAFFGVSVHGQTLPTGTPQRVQHPYYQYDGFVEAKGGLLLSRRVANFTPKLPALIYDTVTGKISFYTNAWKAIQDVAYTADYGDLVNRPDLTQYVPTSRTVNGYSLTSNVTINKVDIGLGNVLNVDATNAINITAGTLPDARLSANVTMQGNTFNGANQLLQLDAGGKVAYANLPAALMIYKGVWDASTNSPTLVNGSGVNGWVYRVHPGGTVNFGAGDITFSSGDYVIYNGSVWQKSGGGDAVTSVNGQQGVVVLSTANISEGGTNYYYTNGRVQTFSDTRYSLLNHEHVYSDIANLGSYTGFDVRYKSISYAPSWSDITSKPTFATVATSGAYNDLSGRPTLGTLAALSSIGNTYITDVAWSKVTGAPSFLTSETDPTIYAWAKASVKPSYTYAEIGGTVPTWNQNTTGNAGTATKAYVTSDNTSTSYYPLVWASTTGTNADLNASPSKILFKPYTGELNGVALVMSGAGSFGGDITFSANASIIRGSYSFSFASTGNFVSSYTNNIFTGTVSSNNTIYSNSAVTESSGYQLNAVTMGYSTTGTYGWITAGGAGARTNLVLQAGGAYVGIGTTDVNYALEVRRPTGIASTSDNTFAANIRAAFNTGNIGGTRNRFDISADQNAIYLVGQDNFPVVFGSNGVDRGRMTPSGRWLFGTSTDNGADIIQANGRVNATGYVASSVTSFFIGPAVNSSLYDVAVFYGYNQNSKFTVSNNTSNSANITLTRSDGTQMFAMNGHSGNMDVAGSVTATSLIKSGGTSSQFLKADGSVDGNTYLTSAVTSIAGTSNQIAVSAATGAVTVSLTNNVVIPGTITSSASYESSDRRLKIELTGTRLIGRIESLQARLYEKDGRDEYGYYAQDALTIIPTAVKQRPDGYYDLSYTQVFVVKIASLEKRVLELETLLQKIYAR